MCILNVYKPARMKWVLPSPERYVKFTSTLFVYCLHQLLKNVKCFLQMSTDFFSSELNQPFLLCEGGSFKAIRSLQSQIHFKYLIANPCLIDFDFGLVKASFPCFSPQAVLRHRSGLNMTPSNSR